MWVLEEHRKGTGAVSGVVVERALCEVGLRREVLGRGWLAEGSSPESTVFDGIVRSFLHGLACVCATTRVAW